MIIEVSLKTPDALRDSITSAVKEKIERNHLSDDLEELDLQYLIEDETDKILQFAERWFQYGETVTLLLDTVAGTCTVDTA